MRNLLSKTSGQRKKFKAVFVRIGKKVNYKGYSEETLLFKDITDLETREIVADHVWFSFTKGFQDAGLKEGKEGNWVEFEARVAEYQKGYVNRSLGKNNKSNDYKLSNPTKIRIP